MRRERGESSSGGIGVVGLLGVQFDERDDLLAALDQMIAWARHVEATGERELVLRDHIRIAEALLVKYGVYSVSVLDNAKAE